MGRRTAGKGGGRETGRNGQSALCPPIVYSTRGPVAVLMAADNQVLLALPLVQPWNDSPPWTIFRGGSFVALRSIGRSAGKAACRCSLSRRRCGSGRTELAVARNVRQLQPADREFSLTNHRHGP